MAASRRLLTVLANVLLAGGILVFAAGFFPYKAVLPGLATWPEGHQSLHERPYAPFNKIIFMVVDALRSDFVYGNTSKFDFTQELIRRKHAIPFTGHASPPTITMPKVKAITTGSVPSFVDLILNFAESDTTSTLAKQDSWLAQMKAKADGKLVMYGDDTWLRLFPGFFDRSDGTTSFFVSDFTEVDNNVTRHVPAELQQDDWSVMVMHYLGLDHIGHKTGPQGPNMPAKQREMDGIVKLIYESMVDEQTHHLKDCLLVLLGDHGMNEAGNHGASSAGETSTALTFISPRLGEVEWSAEAGRYPKHDADDFRYYERVQQSDVAVTLAALLGFPTPKNSLGVIIPRMLELWWYDQQSQLGLVYANAEQLQTVLAVNFPGMLSAERSASCTSLRGDSVREEEDVDLACLWQSIAHLGPAFKGRDFMHKSRPDSTVPDQSARITDPVALRRAHIFSKRVQSLLSSAASTYDLTKMGVGIGLTALSFILSAVIAGPQMINGGVSGIVFTFVLLVYSVTMFASSYVEEEHQFWYWTTAAWLTILTVKFHRFKPDSTTRMTTTTVLLGNLATCVLFGIARRWNQTGQKYAGFPDIVTEVLSTRPWHLWTLIILTYAMISRRLSRRALKLGSFQLAVSPAIVTISAFLFKLSFTAADAPELLKGIRIFESVLEFVNRYPLVSLARVAYAGFGHLLASTFFHSKPWESRPMGAAAQKQTHALENDNKILFLESFHDIISVILVTQTRTVNIPLFLIFYLEIFLIRESYRPFLLPLSPSSPPATHQGGGAGGGKTQTTEEATNTPRNTETPILLEQTITTLLLQQSSFFTLGGTNAISSIDLSNAYNGVSTYNVTLVGLLTFVSNWAGPIWFVSAGVCLVVGPFLLSCRRRQTHQNYQTTTTTSKHVYFDTLTVFATGSTLAVMTACMVLREHLFIWTVFSPKYLYTVAWVFGQHFVVNGLFGGLLLLVCC